MLRKSRIDQIGGPRKGVLAIAVALLGVVAVGCGSSSESGTSTSASADGSKLTEMVVNAPVNVDNAPLNWADSKGLFAKAGIKLKYMDWTSQNALPTVLNGQAAVSVAGGGAVVGWLSQGQPLKMVAGAQVQGKTVDDTSTSIVATPDSGVTSLADLNGKSVALTGLSGTSLAFAKWQVKNGGGDPASVKFTVVPFAGMVTALKGNKVDAAVIAEPYRSQATAAGMKVLGPAFTPGYSSYFFTSDDYANSHRALLQKFRGVLKQADDYASTHWDEVRDVYAKANGLSAEEAKYLPKAATFDVTVQPDAVKTDVQVMKSANLLGKTPIDTSTAVFE